MNSPWVKLFPSENDPQPAEIAGWRLLLRVVGFGLGAWLACVVLAAAMFRMDSMGELPRLIRLDVQIGLAAAIAVALVRTPAAGQGNRGRHVRTLLLAVAVGTMVAGGLAWLHYTQYLIRSTPPAGIAPP